MSNESINNNCICPKRSEDSLNSDTILENIVAKFSEERRTESNFRLRGNSRDDDSLKSFSSIANNDSYDLLNEDNARFTKKDKKNIKFNTRTIQVQTLDSSSRLEDNDVILMGKDVVLRKSKLALNARKNEALSRVFPQASLELCTHIARHIILFFFKIYT